MKRGKLAACLQLLASYGIVAPIGKNRWRLLQPQVEPRQFESLAGQTRERREQQEVRLQQMTDYAEGSACRWLKLFEYFDEAPPEPLPPCQRCDQCVPPSH